MAGSDTDINCKFKETIKIIRSIFATHGLPEQCVTDLMGVHLPALNFKVFCRRTESNKFECLRTILRQTEWLNEWCKHLKIQWKKMKENKGDFIWEITTMVIYILHNATNNNQKTPSELLMGRKTCIGVGFIETKCRQTCTWAPKPDGSKQFEKA